MTAPAGRPVSSAVTASDWPRPERRGRWLYKAAAAWLLMAAGGHLAGHWLYYADLEAFASAFSLCFALLLAMLGTLNWRLALEVERAPLQRHAWRNGLLFALATLLLLLGHRLLLPLLIFAIAAALFVVAGHALRQPRPGYTG